MRRLHHHSENYPLKVGQSEAIQQLHDISRIFFVLHELVYYKMNFAIYQDDFEVEIDACKYIFFLIVG